MAKVQVIFSLFNLIIIFQENTAASNVDDPKDKSQKFNNIELLLKKEDVSVASPDERPN